MNDKQFYTEFLKQAYRYVKEYEGCYMYLCLSHGRCDIDPETYLSKFGYIVSNKIGKKAINPTFSELNKSQRQEVMTELISYLKDKLNQLK